VYGQNTVREIAGVLYCFCTCNAAYHEQQKVYACKREPATRTVSQWLGELLALKLSAEPGDAPHGALLSLGTVNG